jgi:hypothetical protein
MSLEREAGEKTGTLLGSAHQAIGSVIGRLEAISLHGTPRFNVYDALSQRPVKCEFTPRDLDTVKDALGRCVVVAGIVYRNAAAQPLRVARPTLTILPLEEELPGVDEIVGADPDFTGGMSTEDYVRHLRDA